MNIPLKRLPALIKKECRELDSEGHGFARLLEFKIVSPDGRYHAYIQMLIIREVLRSYGLWRKFKASSSLTHGDTLWEATTEYDPDLIIGSTTMIEERIEDLADKAKVEEKEIALSLEMSKSIALERVTRTQDSKHSFLVRIARKWRQYKHV
jgi:hypothetical protein